MHDTHIVKYPACHGTLSWSQSGKRHEAPIGFSLEVDKTGRIRLEIEDQPLSQTNFWIHTAFSGSSPTVASLRLEARNADGYVLRSDSVHLSSVGTHSTPDSATLRMAASASHLTVLAEQDDSVLPSEFQVEYWVAGLRWFRGARFATATGEVAIAGDVKVDDYSKVSGEIAVRSSAKDKTLDAWLLAVDEEVNRILDIVSFADGHFMRPTVRQAFRDTKLTRVEFLGSRHGASPHKPPLHCLDFTNSLPPLIQAYDASLIERTGLSVAIEWHLMPHVYDEARFVSQMTAIEHLIHVFAEHSPDSTYIDKSVFNKTVAPALVGTLEQQVGSLGLGEVARKDALEGMTQSLKQINRRSLRSNLARMLCDYCVPLDGLSELIGPLITTRNNIVHRGLHERGDDGTALSQRVAEAEEFLRRIVLALLGFQGRYTTWLDKVEDRDFRHKATNTASNGIDEAANEAPLPLQPSPSTPNEQVSDPATSIDGQSP